MALLVHSLHTLKEEWKEGIYELYSVFISPPAALRHLDESQLIPTLHERTYDICRVYFFCPSHWITSPEEAARYDYPGFENGTYHVWGDENIRDFTRATDLGTQELLRRLNKEFQKANEPAQHIVSPSLLFFHPPSENREIFADVYLASLGADPETAAFQLLRPMSPEVALDFNADSYLQWVSEKHYLAEPSHESVSRWQLGQLGVSIVSILLTVLAML